MDYSKRGTIKKQHQIKSTSKRLASKAKITVVRLSLICLVGLLILLGCAGFGALKGMIDNAPDIDGINLIPTSYKTTIYYSDGSIADTLFGSGANREYVYISEIPKCVQYAFVAKEDERFYEHNGIDVKGIFRAIKSVISTRSLEYGASTITQQLLKNQVFSGGDETKAIDKIIRKIQEQYLAIKIENKLDKDTILEYYLNTLNLGNGSYGVQTAAKNYFDKDVWELTLSEASVLAPIAYSPTYRNPVTYPDENAEQRLKCLDLMLEAGFCTQEEYDEAIADKTVYDRIRDHQLADTDSAPYSYFTDELTEQLIADLQEDLGYTEKEASDLLLTGGLKIYTTQDKEIQTITDSIYTDESNFPVLGEGSYIELSYALSVTKKDGSVIHYQQQDLMDYYSTYQDIGHLYYHNAGDEYSRNWVGISELGIDADDINAKCDAYKEAMMEEGDSAIEKRILKLQPQSSMVIMEQSTGKVVAIYGGRGIKTESLVLNRATNTVRQVGSTFKVLASFLPALDSAGMTLATVFDDSKFIYPGKEKEVINWYADKGYRGLQSIRTAIYNSMNIIAVKCLEVVTPQIGFDYLEKLGFTTLIASETVGNQTYTDIGLPLALGGITNGVTNLELTAAYASIANGGKYQEPIFYTLVLDHDGNVLLSNESNSSQVMKASTAWLLTDAMEDTITEGTGSRLAFTNYEMPVAGKTGTAAGSNDLWFIGYTPYYTAGIWTGFDNNLDQTSTKYHQYMWQKIMEQIHITKQLANVPFEMPDSIVTAQVCSKCGKLAVVGLCDHYLGGDCIVTEYFAKGTAPTEKCDCHVKVSMCKDSGHIATASCPAGSVEEIVYLLKTEDPLIPATYDTPFIMPTGKAAEPCPLHSGTSGTSTAVPTEDAILPIIPDDVVLPAIDEPADDTVLPE